MNINARVLRALFLPAGRRGAISKQEIAERSGASLDAVEASILRLRAAGLAELRPTGSPRLTLAGLAVAASLAAPRFVSRPSQRMSRAA